MDVKTTLQWASPFSLSLVLALVVLAGLGLIVLRRAAGRPLALARRPALLLIRLLIVAILVLIVINPVRVAVTPGILERPRVIYLVDTSQSMALGQKASRWNQVETTIRDAERLRDSRTGAQVSVFRFGSRLAAVDPALAPAPAPAPAGPSLVPNDSDTLLAGALEGLAGRLGQVPPQALVVFSDGRARDPGRVEPIARGFGLMKVPIHVVPVGDPDVGGDIAIVSMVAPPQVRKHSRVTVQVFIRSYGYKGQRIELKLVAVTAGPDAASRPVLARTPVVLQEGITSASLTFDSGDEDRRIEARIDPRPGEVSAENNVFAADVAIDHTKIRILYLEGALDRYVQQRAQRKTQTKTQTQSGQSLVQAAYSALQTALMEDPDIECTAVLPAGGEGDFGFLVRADDRARGLPQTPSEWFAYDAIILSNIAREALSDQQLSWLDEWISRRGGGLAMVGGPYSFASGHWDETPVGAMLPVELLGGSIDWDERRTSIEPIAAGALHPIWQIALVDAENRTLLNALPPFLGRNRLGRLKPGADLLARVAGSALGSADEPPPALAVQPYGRGRTLALSTAITRRWASGFVQSWGGSDSRYYKKFWRNAVYWLTENSSIGRRRLVAETDKRLYSPGEPIVIRARTLDENAAATLDYRVAATVEPPSAGDVTSDDSPLRRPSGGAAPAREPSAAPARSPLLPWGEEFDLARLHADKAYITTLPIADARSLPAGTPLSRALRIELTAYEGTTQVDSTALDVQILDDPSEQQNPLPDHELLHRIAAWSGGKVLHGPSELAATLGRLPTVVGPPEIRKAPAWNQWWLLMLLIALLSTEWIWRRRLGLA
jgi:uncharacterized membrane protein